MYTLILLVHVVVCVFLIFVVLVQDSKGAQLGAAFGGSSQTLFGARGSATFLSKLTTTMAVVFMLTSLVLAVMSVRKSSLVRPATTTGIPGDKKAGDAGGMNKTPGPLGENKAQGAPGDTKAGENKTSGQSTAAPAEGGKTPAGDSSERDKK
jgi:preprotein translocase subunit SecG